jgi:hypothetical protein
MSPEEHEIAKAICAYLEEHPAATDTITGIAEWWIARQRIRGELEKVTRVVESLRTTGVLEVVTIGGQVAYRLARNPPAGRREP